MPRSHEMISSNPTEMRIWNLDGKTRKERVDLCMRIPPGMYILASLGLPILPPDRSPQGGGGCRVTGSDGTEFEFCSAVHQLRNIGVFFLLLRDVECPHL